MMQFIRDQFGADHAHMYNSYYTRAHFTEIVRCRLGGMTTATAIDVVCDTYDCI